MKLELIFGLALPLGICLISSAANAQTSGQIGSPSMNSPTSSGSSDTSKSQTAASTTLGPIALPEDFSKLKIAPGFLLNEQVIDEPDLTATLRVSVDGDVIVPMAGKVHVSGDTILEAQQKIQEALRNAEILKDPQVNLDIAQYAPSIVTVLGEVRQPGRYPMQSPRSLLDMISLAGGETDMAGAQVQVQRIVDGQVETSSYRYLRDSDSSEISKVVLQSGDTVTVARAGIVYVLGAVNRPGGYLMQEDGKLDVAQALSLAEGTTLIAKTTELNIIRRNPDGTYLQFHLDYQKMVKGKVTPPHLEAQDIVYVPVSRIKASLSSATALVGQLSSATIYTTRY